MKARNFLLALLMLFVAVDLYFEIFSGRQMEDSPNLTTALWLCRLFLDLGVLLIVYCFYQLQNRYAQKGFLDHRSVVLLQTIAYTIGGLSIVYAAHESFQRLWESIILYGHKLTTGSYAFFISDFIGSFLVKTPFLIVLVLCLFLMTDFAKRAIALKNENESFI